MNPPACALLWRRNLVQRRPAKITASLGLRTLHAAWACHDVHRGKSSKRLKFSSSSSSKTSTPSPERVENVQNALKAGRTRSDQSAKQPFRKQRVVKFGFQNMNAQNALNTFTTRCECSKTLKKRSQRVVKKRYALFAL